MRIEDGMALAAAALALGLLAGCGDDDGGGGAPDDAGVDAGSTADAGPDGGAASPFPAPEDCAACEGTRACVRGVCVDLCGGDAAEVDAALAEGVAPIAGYCRTAVAAGAGPASTVVDLQVLDDGDAITATLASFPLTPGNVAPTAAPRATFEVTPALDGMPLFWSGFVAAGPGDAPAAVGYTQGFGDPGRLFVVGEGDPIELPAPGNFDVAWLDASTLLVDGQGVGDDAELAQGLDAVRLDGAGNATARRVLGNAFAFSGSVAVVGDLVLYGALADDFSDRLLVLAGATIDSVLDGGSDPVDALADDRVVEVPGGPSAFVHLGDGRLAVRRFNAEFETELSLVETTGSTPDAFALGAPTPLAGPPGDDPGAFEQVFSDAIATGDPDRPVLVHGTGLLLVDLRAL